MKQTASLSIIIPVFNEKGNVSLLHQKIKNVMDPLTPQV